MAQHMQFNESFTEAQILSLTAIPERNVSDVYKASDTGNHFEVLEDLSVASYSRVDAGDLAQEIADRQAGDNALDTRLQVVESQLPDDDTALANEIATNAAAIASEISQTDGEITALLASVAGNTAATNANASGLSQEILDRQAGDTALQAAIDALSLNVTTEPEYEYHNIFGEDSGNSNNGFLFSYGNGDTGGIGFRVAPDSELIGIGFQADNGGTNGGLDIEVVDISNIAAITVIHTHNVSGTGDGINNNAHTYESLRSNPVAIPNGAVVALRIANEFGAYNSYRVNYEYRTPTGRQIVTGVTLS